MEYQVGDIVKLTDGCCKYTFSIPIGVEVKILEIYPQSDGLKRWIIFRCENDEVFPGGVTIYIDEIECIVTPFNDDDGKYEGDHWL